MTIWKIIFITIIFSDHDSMNYISVGIPIEPIDAYEISSNNAALNIKEAN